MIKAIKIKLRVDELKQIREELKIAEQQKIKNDRISSELLEVEKAINMFNQSLSSVTGEGLDKCKYIKVDMVLSEDVKEILMGEGYYIANLYKNETRLYFDEITFLEGLAQHESHSHDISIPKHGYDEIKFEKYVDDYLNSEPAQKIMEDYFKERGYNPVTEHEKSSKMSILPICLTRDISAEDTEKVIKEIKQSLDSEMDKLIREIRNSWAN